MSLDQTAGTPPPPLCPNCQAAVESGTCAVCGTIIHPPQVSHSTYWEGLKKELFNHGKKIRWTTRTLLTRPGKAVQAWAENKEKKVMHPIRFLFVMAGMNIVMARWMHIGHGTVQGDTEQAILISQWISQYFAFVWIALIPAMALGPWLVERRRFPAYPTHLGVVTYMTAINCLLAMPFLLIEWIWPEGRAIRLAMGMTIPFLYNTWLFHSFYQAPVARTVLSVLLSWILGILLFFMLYIAIYLVMAMVG
ncbi:MAG: DUF3667 domain-containing protein [Saprospiraceae bacterium]